VDRRQLAGAVQAGELERVALARPPCNHPCPFRLLGRSCAGRRSFSE
jgi:hypothetical protein